MIDLKGKTAIVTGSRRGIGLGIARKFHSLGSNVVVSDLSLKDCKKICRELGGRCIAVKCDVSNRDDAKEMIKRTIEEFGKLDIMVNNAGIFPNKGFFELEEDMWEKTIDINLKGVFNCTQEAARVMGKGGRIISISSIASHIGFQGLSHYCASKAGVDGFTRAVALELAGKGITVNAVCPGLIETPGVADTFKDPEFLKKTLEGIPLGRAGKPEDIANLVAFLASDEAGYITGQTIVIDGGWIIQ
jgi:3-oxoacyl-[acyl-carrier protein] reductase